MSRTPVKFDDIEVLISHPWVNDYIPLRTWMQIGPGLRPLVGVAAARHAVTKKPLPMSAIPLAYRNTRWSRLLVQLRLIKPPAWPSTASPLRTMWSLWPRLTFATRVQ